jgi:hypothetical protein
MRGSVGGWEKKAPTDQSSDSAYGGWNDSVSLAWGLGKRYQEVTYHDHHGYHNRKARLMPRSFFEK